ncbi:hypothetical protein TeGR_g3279 [Tetraparma gracilis]|uniref:Sphingomyelin synthase-like domain-containing protein n=1 Tax=Tetraparma gracilis TaxID=2962635 RepID=A0ABQ6N7V0_9STRA|nr:hypothetical protein TeGR_g3279 [Tetraparma gracilis]
MAKALHYFRLLPIVKGWPEEAWMGEGLFRLLLSTLIAVACAEWMAIFGGAYARAKMPKQDYKADFGSTEYIFEGTSPYALPDSGFDVIPYNCPLPGPMNLQTLMIGVFYTFYGVRCFTRRDGRLIVARIMHMFAVIYMLRWCTVGVTHLPNPNPACQLTDRLGSANTWLDAVKYVAKRFPPVACGDFIFSGHGANLTFLCMFGFKFKLWFHPIGYAFSIATIVVGYWSLVACRSHYTVDVILGIMMAMFATEMLWVYSPTSRIICWLEMMPVKKLVYVDPDEDVGFEAIVGDEEAALKRIKDTQAQLLDSWGFSVCPPTDEVPVPHLRKQGDPKRPPVLALHGMTQDKSVFAPFLAAAKIDRTVIVPDLAGHGDRIQDAIESGEVGWTNEERAAEMLQFLDQMGVERCDVYGYSMGGGVAMKMAELGGEKVGDLFLVAPACCLTASAIEETNSGLVRYNFQTVEEAEAFLQLVGFPDEVAKQRAPMTAYLRAGTGVDEHYWGRMWSGTANGLVEVGLSIEEAMMDGLKESCERMKREGRRVVVAQGDSDDVIHADVPRNILDVLGEEDCGVVEMEGMGHAGSRGDPDKYIATAVARHANAFFNN